MEHAIVLLPRKKESLMSDTQKLKELLEEFRTMMQKNSKLKRANCAEWLVSKGVIVLTEEDLIAIREYKDKLSY